MERSKGEGTIDAFLLQTVTLARNGRSLANLCLTWPTIETAYLHGKSNCAACAKFDTLSGLLSLTCRSGSELGAEVSSLDKLTTNNSII